MKRFFVVVGLLSLAACGGTEPDGFGDGPCVDDGSMCATLHLPADFVGEPVKIIAGMYERVPPDGPPIDVAALMEMPAIEIGSPLEMEARDMQVSGSYFVYIALYVEGGGNFVPVPGVDYVWQSEQKFTFGGGPINLGDVEFELAPETE